MISLSHCVAKAVRRPPGALHLSYCFSPMRYLWDLYDDYFGARAGLLVRSLMPPVAAALRAWDRRTDGVDAFVAISHHIADRIRRVYGRSADVIHPPVDVARFSPAARVEDFYLVVSAFTPYKRVDLAIAACQRLGKALVVIGTGQDANRLKALAGPSVRVSVSSRGLIWAKRSLCEPAPASPLKLWRAPTKQSNVRASWPADD